MNPPVAPFTAPYTVALPVNFDDRNDDQRRIKAEYWCCHQTTGRWFRSVDKRYECVSFSFDDLRDAALFRLSH